MLLAPVRDCLCRSSISIHMIHSAFTVGVPPNLTLSCQLLIRLQAVLAAWRSAVHWEEPGWRVPNDWKRVNGTSTVFAYGYNVGYWRGMRISGSFVQIVKCFVLIESPKRFCWLIWNSIDMRKWIFGIDSLHIRNKNKQISILRQHRSAHFYRANVFVSISVISTALRVFSFS